MNIPRRHLLRAAAASPLLVVAPGLVRVAASAPDAVARGLVLEARELSGLSLSWRSTPGPESGTETVARVRALMGHGWDDWIAIQNDAGHGPIDPSGRQFSPAVLVPRAEAYEIEPAELAGVTDLRHHPIESDPQHLRTLVDEGYDPGPLTTVEPIAGLSIVERSNWTTRRRRDTIDCVLGSSVFGLGCRSDIGLRHAIVHHTVNVNSYNAADVPSLLRGIQRYHVDTRGWDDIAYNFVIDRFGRIWHARDGAVDEPITGGHTTGLNAESVGVAILGTFVDVDPGSAVVESLGALLGWKLGLHGVDPLGTTEVRSSGGDYADHDEMVEVRNISGHRDNQQTSCPGTLLYDRLDEVRNAAAELVPVFGTLTPAYRLDEIDLRGWALDRFDQSAKVAIDVVVDSDAPITISAAEPSPDLAAGYPDAGADHGFSHTVPIDIDTISITVTARAADGRDAQLMALTLFAGFIDVEPERFFAPGVYFLRQKELTTGTAAGLFEPMDELTRGQMATFLHRFMDLPVADARAPFSDVLADSFYSDAVDWLFEAGVTTGTSSNTFSPDQFVTRAQMATFLWRLCGSATAERASPFEDVESPSYFAEAVAWLAEMGITIGKTPTTFDPHGLVTRGEMATFIHRLATTPEAWTRVTPPPVVTESA